jgi:YbbR domain-containing protein
MITRLREMLLENWTLKLVAVLLAWILWLFIRGDTGAERVITVPLEVRIDRNMEITNERPTSVDVTLRGNTSNMGLAQSVPACVVELLGASEGEHVLPLTFDNIRLPRASGLEVLKVSPARVELVLEKTVSKEVPVEVPIQGAPADGFDVYSKSASPALVVVTGPRTHVDKLRQVMTEPVSVAGRRQPEQIFANLNIKDNFIRTSSSGPVQVNIVVGPRRRTVIVRDIAVILDSPDYGSSPRTVAASLLVPVSLEEKITAADLVATVSTRRLNPEAMPVRVRPNVVFAIAVDPAIVIREVIPPDVLIERKGPTTRP